MLELFVLKRPVGDLNVVGVSCLLQSLLEFTQLGDFFVERLQTGLLGLQVEFEIETRSWWGSRVDFCKWTFMSFLSNLRIHQKLTCRKQSGNFGVISQRSSLNSASSEWMWLRGHGCCNVEMHCTITITSSADVAGLAGSHGARREGLGSLDQAAAVLDGVNCGIAERSRGGRSNAVSQSHHGVALLLILRQEFSVCLSINGFDVENIKVLYFVHERFEHLCS